MLSLRSLAACHDCKAGRDPRAKSNEMGIEIGRDYPTQLVMMMMMMMLLRMYATEHGLSSTPKTKPVEKEGDQEEVPVQGQVLATIRQ